MVLNKEKVINNLKELNSFIEKYITDNNRKEKINKLLEDYDKVLITAPASSRKQFHNCFPGGYVDHIVNVVKNAFIIKSLWENTLNRKMKFTDEELFFSCLFHDLGKLGVPGTPLYIENDNKWQIQNQSALYKKNENLRQQTIEDRTFMILAEYGIKYNINEFYGIKLADGLYSEETKIYLNSGFEGIYKLKTEIHYIIHWADMLSTIKEYLEVNDNDISS